MNNDSEAVEHYQAQVPRFRGEFAQSLLDIRRDREKEGNLFTPRYSNSIVSAAETEARRRVKAAGESLRLAIDAGWLPTDDELQQAFGHCFSPKHHERDSLSDIKPSINDAALSRPLDQEVVQKFEKLIGNTWVRASEEELASTKMHLRVKRAARRAEQIVDPRPASEQTQGVVFISCGQFAEHERDLGQRLADLIEQYTEYVGYFAQNEQNLGGLSTNILGALEECVGLVVVMHKRGSVETPDRVIERGSVWVEQEIAIAAFIQHTGRQLPVAAYIEKGIAREGIRQLLQLNPHAFASDDEVVAHFEEQLRARTFLPGEAMREVNERAFAVQPIMHLRVDQGLSGPDGSYLTGFLRTVGRGIARNPKLMLPGLEAIDIDALMKPTETFDFGRIRYDNRSIYTQKLDDPTLVVRFEDELGNLYEQRGEVEQRKSSASDVLQYLVKGLGPVKLVG
jgi:hypothetical protein